MFVQVYSLLSAPTEDAPRLVQLALLQGSAGKRIRAGFANYYKKVRRSSQRNGVCVTLQVCNDHDSPKCCDFLLYISS